MITPKKLRRTLEEHCPPRRIVATCDECGEELFDSKKKDLGASPVKNSVPFISSWIYSEIATHQAETGDHDDYSIAIDAAGVVRGIEANVEVKTSG